MKKVLILGLAILFIQTFLPAQNNMEKSRVPNKPRSTAGYLVDYTCGKGMVMDDVKKSDAKAARHTKACALDEACSAKGYGLVAGGKFYKFDASGDMKAKEYLNVCSKEDNIKVEVIGAMDGEKLVVASIKDLKPAGRKK